jgi:hypothetical protein
MDSSIDIDILDLIPLIILGAVEGTKPERMPQNTGQKGGVYLEELLSSTTNRIYDVLRMKKETFITLTRYTSVQEQVFMFLWTLNYSASNQSIRERFQHSGETVSR